MPVGGIGSVGLRTYLKVCSLGLARAQARTGDAAAIDGYLGKNDTFAEAIVAFALAYADQTGRDYEVLVQAVKNGRIAVEISVQEGEAE